MIRQLCRHALVTTVLLLAIEGCLAQVVSVTVSLETNSVAVGGSTRLHVFAQIVPAQRASADQIFSWYVDLLSLNGPTATANYDALLKPTSDNDPQTSSKGTTDGVNRRGIYDTFLNLPNAGRDAPVELFSVPVTALAPGRASFAVQAGTTVSQLSEDFIVAPTGGGNPLSGGEVLSAKADLQVTGSGGGPRLFISSSPLPAQRQLLTITFVPTTGKTYFVEFRNSLGSGLDWQALPGAPHNSGSVTDTNQAPQRFYRLRAGN